MGDSKLYELLTSFTRLTSSQLLTRFIAEWLRVKMTTYRLIDQIPLEVSFLHHRDKQLCQFYQLHLL